MGDRMIAELEEEVERLKGCEEQSIIRGNDCIALGREIFDIRAQRDRLLDYLKTHLSIGKALHDAIRKEIKDGV